MVDSRRGAGPASRNLPRDMIANTTVTPPDSPRAEPAFDQKPLFIQNRLGDRNDMSVDALEIPQHVQMQRGGIMTFGLTLSQPDQMVLG